jgi:RHS repeat-associated protein
VLGRILTSSDGGGGTLTHAYSQNDETVTRSPAPSGENTKRRQYEYDGQGRLTSVCELTSATGSGSCAQTNAQTGYWTKYSYDALGRLTGVTQNAQSSSLQTRTYGYDLLGRLISETNPESGTKTYVYDSDSTMCGNGAYTSNGDLVKTSDAAGNCVMRYYDALHRLTDVGNNNQSVSHCKRLRYDNSSGYPGSTKPSGLANTLGRLVEAATDKCDGTGDAIITDEWFSYSPRGEVSDIYESTPNSGGYYHVSSQYWANGAIKQLASLAGLPTITYAVDGEGRPYQASASSGQNPVTNTLFNSASLPTSMTYGSADADSYSYDSNTNRLTQYQFAVNGQSFIGALTWNANHSLQSLQITDPFNSGDNQTCTFGYDDLKRLQSANCGTAASQTFAYDPFGNISKSGSPYSFQPTYSTSTNQMTSLPGFTPTYDANGNTTNDSNHTYGWDAYGKAITVDSVNLTFDALGRMVEQNRSGTYTQIVYSPGGGKLALLNGQMLQKAIVPLPGGGQAVYNSSGLLYYGHSDHLGSIRLGSTPSRTMYFSMAYAPFGETYAQSGTTDPAFTGQRQDTVGGLYDFPARQYSIQGRWPSPDPSGLNSVTLFDPQTLNRYAYVRNSPLGMLDSNGLCGMDVTKNHANPDHVESASLGPADRGSDMAFLQQDDGGNGDCIDIGGGSGSGGGGGTGDAGWSDSGNGVDPSNGDPTSSGDTNNSGSDCAANGASCGNNSGDQSSGDLADLPLCAPGSDCVSAAGAACDLVGLLCGTKTLEDNLANDRAIFDMTAPFATDPFAMAQSTGAVLLAEVNYLEKINLVIDNVALDNLAMSALDHIPGVDLLPPGVEKAADLGIDYFESVRDKNNQQIDQLLGQAGQSTPRPHH